MAHRNTRVETIRASGQAATAVGQARDVSDAGVSGQFLSATRTPLRKRGKGRAAEGKLHAFNNLPDHLADNEYIREYYRADYSIKESVLSLFRIHNETGNIWTHLLGRFPSHPNKTNGFAAPYSPDVPDVRLSLTQAPSYAVPALYYKNEV